MRKTKRRKIPDQRNDQREDVLNRIRMLRSEVYGILCNKLTYPKTVIGLLRKGKLSEDKVLRLEACIDESIACVEAKFIQMMNELGAR